MADARVAVLFGGPSAEHEVSLRSARSVVEALLVHHPVWPVLLERDGSARSPLPIPRGGAAPDLQDAPGVWRCWDRMADLGPALVDQADVVFPCVHGRWGEDGVLQGWAECLGLPVVGSDVAASALAMDKQRAKEVLAARTDLRLAPSVVHPRHRVRQAPDQERERARSVPLPWFVKPSRAGSSVGLTRVTRHADWDPAVHAALSVPETDGAMVEAAVDGEEVTCLVVGNPDRGLRAFPPVLIRPLISDVFDYAAKYQPGGSEELCPAPLAADVLRRIEAAAVLGCHALGLRGVARLDFIVDAEGAPWFLEANTMPGFTRESLAPRAAQAGGLTLPAFFHELVELALADAAPRSRTRGAS